MFWALAAFGALLIDRDRSRELLAAEVARAGAAPGRGSPGCATGRGWAAGRGAGSPASASGSAAGTKWSGLFFLVVFGLMTVLWDMGARRAAGVRRWLAGRGGPRRAVRRRWSWSASRRRHLPRVVGRLVPLHATATTGSGAAQHPSKRLRLGPRLRCARCGTTTSEMYQFHVTLTSPHPYQTNPWSWLIQGRPTSFFYEGPKKGARRLHGRPVLQGDHLDRHRRRSGGARTLAMLRPALHAGRCAATGAPAAILAGLAAGYLPWFQLRAAARSTRSTRSPSCRGSCSRVVYVLGLVLGPATASVAGAGWGLGLAVRRLRRADRGAVRVLLPDLHRAGHPATPQWAAADVVPQLDLTRVSGRRPGTAAAGPAWSPARPVPPPAGHVPAARRTGTRRPSSRGG